MFYMFLRISGGFKPLAVPEIQMPKHLLSMRLRQDGLEEDAIVVFTSDHGDMLGSQGELKKPRPRDESIRIPLLIRWPKGLGAIARTNEALIDVIDHQPTLLDLCGLTGGSFFRSRRNVLLAVGL